MGGVLQISTNWIYLKMHHYQCFISFFHLPGSNNDGFLFFETFLHSPPFLLPHTDDTYMLLHISTSGVPFTVKLIDIMRTDPLKRFVVNGDGNALRVTLNSESQRSSVNKEYESGFVHDHSHSNATVSNFSHIQHEERYDQQRHEPTRTINGHSVLQGPGPQYPPNSPSTLCMGPYQGPGPGLSENINIGHDHLRDDLLEHQQHLHGVQHSFPTRRSSDLRTWTLENRVAIDRSRRLMSLLFASSYTMKVCKV